MVPSVTLQDQGDSQPAEEVLERRVDLLCPSPVQLVRGTPETRGGPGVRSVTGKRRYDRRESRPTFWDPNPGSRPPSMCPLETSLFRVTFQSGSRPLTHSHPTRQTYGVGKMGIECGDRLLGRGMEGNTGTGIYTPGTQVRSGRKGLREYRVFRENG